MLHLEEAVRGAHIACPLEVPRSLLFLASNLKVLTDVVKRFALVPEVQHPHQVLDAPFLQSLNVAHCQLAAKIHPGALFWMCSTT